MPQSIDLLPRLQARFERLKVERGGTKPLYALEHGLDEAQVKQLNAALARSMAPNLPPQDDHWLGWVVAATEVGYGFSGTEYWPSLQQRFPRWCFSDRERLTKWFKRFHSRFGGAKPGGTWASHRNLIAWPVTHAVLPRDLQRQLSHTVCDARFDLVGLDAMPNEDIGKVIQRRAVTHGDRFTRFVRDHEFVGQLTRMLIVNAEASEDFSPALIERIVADLNKHVDARAWLKEARAYCRPRFKLQGAKGGSAQRAATQSQSSLTPDLRLRFESGAWNLYMCPASALPLLRAEPALSEELTRLRFRIDGGGDQQYMGRDLLVAQPRPRPLKVLPFVGQPLMQCEPSDTALAALLRNESALPSRRLFVFRKAPDGSASLLSAAYVSPGNTYLLAGKKETLEPLPGQWTSTGGAFSLKEWTVPEDLPVGTVESLRTLGITVTLTVAVRAWGITPRRWIDGVVAEYVEGESILLRVDRNHAFDVLRYRIDDRPVVDCVIPGNAPVMIELSGLSSGSHRLALESSVHVSPRNTFDLSTVARGQLNIFVRPPSVWSPGYVPHEGLLVESNPSSATLDDVCLQRVEIGVRGSAQSPVHAELVMLSDLGEETRRTIVRRRPPITPTEWKQKLANLLAQGEIDVLSLGASSASLSFTCDGYGEHRMRLGVFPGILRWSAQPTPDKTRVRLSTESDRRPVVALHRFATPLLAEPLTFEQCERGLDDADGLLLATCEDARALLLVSNAPHGWLDLKDLNSAKQVLSLSQAGLTRLLAASRMWSEAPMVGRGVRLRWMQTLSSIKRALLSLALDGRWLALEEQFESSRDWEPLEAGVRPASSPSYGITLGRLRTCRDLAMLRRKFGEASTAYSVCADPSMINDAWCLMFAAESLPADWAPPTGPQEGVFRQLARGARLVQLGFEQAAAS